MEKKVKIPNAIKANVDDAAVKALNAGKGQRVYGGGTSGITVGDEYSIKGVTYTEQLMPPTGMDNAEWRGLSEAEQREQGVQRGWFAFTTNNGNLAFSAVMGEKGMDGLPYWQDVPAEQKAEGFDPTKIFKPSARTAETWVEAGCDGLIGKTIRCVATKEYEPEGQSFTIRVRAWEIVE